MTTLIWILAVVAALLAGLAAGLAIGMRIGRPQAADLSDNSDHSDHSDEADETDKADAAQEAQGAESSRKPEGGEWRRGELMAEGELTDADREQVERMIRYIESHLREPELSVEELSDHMNMSRVHLYRKVKAATGRTPIELIRVVRLRWACNLLQKDRHSVAAVAKLVGFNSPRIFSRYFREEYGVLPSEYRENV